MKHIVARLDVSDGDAVVLDYALQIAKRLSAHVDALFCRFEPKKLAGRVQFRSMAAITLDDFIAQVSREAGEKARQNFEDWLRDNRLADNRSGEPGFSLSWRELTGWEADLLAQVARLTDLTIIAHPSADTAAGTMALETALFDARRAVLLVPRGSRSDIFYRPIIAWNGSAEAAQAVGGAIPLLAHATEPVEVFSVPEAKHRADPDELIAYLRWHSILAVKMSPHDTRESVGEALLRQANARRSGLIVMGAYTHGHLRQFIFGGVTRHIIDHAAIPILMAH